HLRFDNATPEEVKKGAETALERNLVPGQVPIVKLYFEGKISHGFTSLDMGIGHIIKRYSDREYIDLDASRLKNVELEGEIEALRDNKIGSITVKEMGLSILM